MYLSECLLCNNFYRTEYATVCSVMTVPIRAIRWYRLQCYAWYRFSAIVSYQHMEKYSQEIKAQLDVTRNLSKPLNKANNRYDSIGYREHTAEEEKQAEKEYERYKAEYDREKTKLNELYDRQKAARTEAFQYMKNCCADIYGRSGPCHLPIGLQSHNNSP